ncbi:MAG: RHS repeat domain-containing protein, partial [Gammaproteobacteria bacterium]
PWQEGKERQTQTFRPDNGNLLRQSDVEWEEGASGGPPEPPRNARIKQVQTTLSDSGQASKEVYQYDQYNNRTQVEEFDFGSSTAARLTLTSYLTGGQYDNNTIHIRNLVQTQWIYEGAQARASTSYEYDNYIADPDNSHAPLLPRDGITGHDTANFGAGEIRRGNVTMVQRWLNTLGASPATFQHYDIAGNMVKRWDANGNSTLIEYSQIYGYALPTKVTNALGHETVTEYSLALGKPTRVTDPNNTVTTFTYDDPLDRLKQVVRAPGVAAVQTQTTFNYDDANRTITTTSDQNAYLDNRLKTEVVYDGLGRQSERRQYEDAVKQEYDEMGRVFKVWNPFHEPLHAGETLRWTTTEYDTLGRIKQVTLPDNSTVVTTYTGNETTVSDPAGIAKKSLTDALGRLTEVIENSSGPAADQVSTKYRYDALDNLKAVCQAGAWGANDSCQNGQGRKFIYDSWSRLTSATNPEYTNASGGNGTASFAYDANGNLTSKTDARGVATTFDPYDALNRPTRTSYSDGTQ